MSDSPSELYYQLRQEQFAADGFPIWQLTNTGDIDDWKAEKAAWEANQLLQDLVTAKNEEVV